MATPKKKNPKDTSCSSVENSDSDGSSSESDAGQEAEASDESFSESDISGLSDTKDSETQESYQDLPARHSRKSAADTKQSFHGHTRPSRKGRYNAPTEPNKVRYHSRFLYVPEPKKVRAKAQESLSKALDQVPDTIHMNRKGKRTKATLYVGNLDYKASKKELTDELEFELQLDKYFGKIHLEEVVIPKKDGRSRGYAFITLS